MYCPQKILENLYHYKETVLLQLIFSTASSNIFRIQIYKRLIFWLLHVNVW